jgi:quaternary ammonium compound-resistance protein SugE
MGFPPSRSEAKFRYRGAGCQIAAPARAFAGGYNPIPMDWILLLVAGLLEVGWAIGLKYTDGFTRLWPSVWTGAAMVASIVLLALALRSIPVGTGYAVWTGIGAAGTAILGIVLFAEPATAARLGCIALIVAGIAGLKLVTPA